MDSLRFLKLAASWTVMVFVAAFIANLIVWSLDSAADRKFAMREPGLRARVDKLEERMDTLERTVYGINVEKEEPNGQE